MNRVLQKNIWGYAQKGIWRNL